MNSDPSAQQTRNHRSSLPLLHPHLTVARALGPVGSLERCLAETQGTAVVRPPHRTRCNHARQGLAVRESDYIASSLAARKQNVQRIVETVYACLRRMPALAQLPNESILRMARMGRLQRRSRYQKIYHEGARPEGLFVLVSGRSARLRLKRVACPCVYQRLTLCPACPCWQRTALIRK